MICVVMLADHLQYPLYFQGYSGLGRLLSVQNDDLNEG